MHVSERINLIINHLKLNKNSFSKAIGLSNNVTIGKILNDKRSPSFDILTKIIQTYDCINSHWLLTGEGEMLNTTETTTKEKSSPEKDFVLKPIDDSLGIDPSNMTPLEYYMAIHDVQSKMIDDYDKKLEDMITNATMSIDNVNRLIKIVEKLKKENEELKAIIAKDQSAG